MWKKLKAAQEQRAEFAAKMTAILDKAESEKRDCNKTESDEFDSIRAQATEIEKQIERLQSVYNLTGNTEAARMGVLRPAIGGGSIRDYVPGSAFGLERRFLDALPAELRQNGGENLSIGKIMKGLATGEWRGADAEKRAMSESSQSAGGALVPTFLAANIIDLARAKTRVLQAGASTIPMAGATLKVARLTGDVTPSWRAEGAAISATGATFDSVTLAAKSLAGTVAVSIELLDDSTPNLDSIINESISKAVAIELDRAAMFGTGANNQPTGVANTSGVITTNAVGTPANYNPWSVALQNIRQNNGSPTAAIVSPRTMGGLDRLADSLGQPLRKPPSLENFPMLDTTTCPINGQTYATFQITGNPTGGTFTVSVTTAAGTQTTAGIAYNASAATVQTAITGLSYVGAGNATVTLSGTTYTVVFNTSLLPWSMTTSGASLTGGSSPAAITTPAVATESTSIVGAWNEVLIGLRQTLFIELTREGQDANGLGWATGHYIIRFTLRGDIAISHQNHFNVLSGILL